MKTRIKVKEGMVDVPRFFILEIDETGTIQTIEGDMQYFESLEAAIEMHLQSHKKPLVGLQQGFAHSSSVVVSEA